MVTTLGRTGSHLADAPAPVSPAAARLSAVRAGGPLPRTGSIMVALSEPSASFNQLDSRVDFSREWWLGGDRVGAEPRCTRAACVDACASASRAGADGAGAHRRHVSRTSTSTGRGINSATSWRSSFRRHTCQLAWSCIRKPARYSWCVDFRAWCARCAPTTPSAEWPASGGTVRPRRSLYPGDAGRRGQDAVQQLQRRCERRCAALRGSRPRSGANPPAHLRIRGRGRPRRARARMARRRRGMPRCRTIRQPARRNGRSAAGAGTLAPAWHASVPETSSALRGSATPTRTEPRSQPTSSRRLALLLVECAAEQLRLADRLASPRSRPCRGCRRPSRTGASPGSGSPAAAPGRARPACGSPREPSVTPCDPAALDPAAS